VRSEDEAPLQTAEDYYAYEATCPASDFLDDLITDDSTSGYMELVVLDDGQFCSWWCALMWDDQLVYDQSALESVVSEVEDNIYPDGADTGPEFLELVSNTPVDLTPTVDFVVSDNRGACIDIKTLPYLNFHLKTHQCPHVTVLALASDTFLERFSGQRAERNPNFAIRSIVVHFTERKYSN